MEEQLVSFETAKLAKEVGFDWECMHIYSDKIIDDGKYVEFWNSNSHKNSKINIPESAKSEDEELITAPTQSLLQKWLREKHNIYIIVFPVDNIKSNWMFEISTILLPENESNNFVLNSEEDLRMHFETYERAMERGLQEILKLIKDTTQ